MIIKTKDFEIECIHTEYDNIFFSNKKTIKITKFEINTQNINKKFYAAMKKYNIAFAYIEIDPSNHNLKRQMHEIGFYYCTTTSKIINRNISKIDYSNLEDAQFQMFEDKTINGLNKIIQIIEDKFDWGRFYEDYYLNKFATDRMKIMLNKLHKDNDVKFLFAKNKKEVVGFFIYKVKVNFIDAVFAGINQKNKVKGINFWLAWHKYVLEEERINRVKTLISLANIGVINIYSKLGYSFYQPKEDYHFFTK